jgi:SAM-dependent methyltransferase
LDVACGGGDVVLALKSLGEREGIPVHVSGCDLSPVALEYARGRAGKRGLEVEFFQHDALHHPLPRGFHFVCSSLFLHHLSEEEAVAFLDRLRGYGARLLIQDLLRTHLGYALAWITVRAVTRSPVVRVDGIRSVLSAYSFQEVEELALRGGLHGARIRRCWPQRFSLAWEAR